MERNSLSLLNLLKPRRSYEKTCVFQDTWACHFPLVEAIVGEDGLVA